MAQFLSGAMVLTLLGGVIGFALAHVLAFAVGTLPLMGPLFQDNSGQTDINFQISVGTVILASVVLTLVGILSGFIPALRASRLDPAMPLRYV